MLAPLSAKRELVREVSPFVAATFERMEVARAARYEDSALLQVANTNEFLAIYLDVLCEGRARKALQTHARHARHTSDCTCTCTCTQARINPIRQTQP
jgi:hypothetical protein